MHGLGQLGRRGPAGPQVARHVPREHARVAHGEVELAGGARVALQLRVGGAPAHRQAGGLAAEHERLVELADARVDLARGGQGGLGARDVAGGQRGGELVERAPERAEQPLRRAAHEQQRVGREGERAHRERDAAADQGLDDAARREPGAGRLEHHEQDRRDRRLGDEQRAAAEQHRRRHREQHHHPDLGGPVAERPHEQVGHADPEHDPADQLQRALRALAVGGAERDHGRDRGEHGLTLGQQQLREVPGRDRGGGRLQDRPGANAQPRERLSGGAMHLLFKLVMARSLPARRPLGTAAWPGSGRARRTRPASSRPRR